MTEPTWTDPAAACEHARAFLRSYAESAGRDRVVVGLSGGVDSAAVAALAAPLFPDGRLICLYLPDGHRPPEEQHRVMKLMQKIGVGFARVDVGRAADAYFGAFWADPVRRGNFCARLRMSVLFDVAQTNRALVLGTSNRSEICLGYFTWHGDSAWSMDPIAQLYKTEVVALAGHLGVLELCDPVPSAGFYPGQTDEKEIGLTYEQADRCLAYLVDGVGDPASLDVRHLSRVSELMAKTKFKRAPAAVADFGRDPAPPEPDRE